MTQGSASSVHLWKEQTWHHAYQFPWSMSMKPIIKSVQAYKISPSHSSKSNPSTSISSRKKSTPKAQSRLQASRIKYHHLHVFNQQAYMQHTPFRFIQQKGKMKAMSYYHHSIYKREIPLKVDRNHDFLNALMWLTFPKTRWEILQQQAQLVSHRAQQQIKHRGTREDLLTLFDESGAIVVTDDLLCYQLIQQRDWMELFWRQRARCHQHVKLYIVGHGLYEQLLKPFIGLVTYAKVYYVAPITHSWSIARMMKYLDQKMCGEIKSHAPLTLSAFPFLGLPYYWPQDEEFYQNTRYFRGPYHAT